MKNTRKRWEWWSMTYRAFANHEKYNVMLKQGGLNIVVHVDNIFVNFLFLDLIPIVREGDSKKKSNKLMNLKKSKTFVSFAWKTVV